MDIFGILREATKQTHILFIHSVYPRYIKLFKIGNSNISEMRDFDRIKDTIKKIIL